MDGRSWTNSGRFTCTKLAAGLKQWAAPDDARYCEHRISRSFGGGLLDEHYEHMQIRMAGWQGVGGRNIFTPP